MKISDLQHPDYKRNLKDWKKFRLVNEGGCKFLERYLFQYSRFEAQEDFKERLLISYNPGDAASVLKTIKNSIFQRLSDVKRIGGPDTYKSAIKNGIDIDNHSLNAFIGTQVLSDLLALGKVYVYIDAPVIPENANKAETINYSPYLYTISAESVPNWLKNKLGNLETVLTKTCKPKLDTEFNLPIETQESYQLFSVKNGQVEIKTYDEKEKETGTEYLNLPEIPIVCIELEDSLLRDVADYQIAMLQLASSDINFLFRANFPLYTEQTDPRFSDQLRGPAHPGGVGTAIEATDSVEARVTRILDVAPHVDENEQQVAAGVGKGRAYGKGLDRPGFVAPPSEPVKASMLKQAEMSIKIKDLVNLNLSTFAASYASAASKQMDQVGLEAGLSYIGLVLEHAENEIARIWSLYDRSEPAKITYPTNYSLRTEKDRLAEAKDLLALQGATPSKLYSKSVSKKVVDTLFGGVITQEELEKIHKEIDAAPGITSDFAQIASDVMNGIVSLETAAKLRGYPDGDVEKAKQEHAEKAAVIASAQAKGTPDKSITPDLQSKNKLGKPQRGNAQG